MKIIKTKQLQKGFTLIEVLLVIVLIGILISIGLVTFNAEARFIDTRNDTRKTHIQTLESAITQYKLQEGDYPTGLSRNYQEICDPEATDCIGFFDLKQFLVPNYLQAIPQDPKDTDNTGGAGYEVAIDTTTNTVSVRLKELLREGGVIIAVNDPLPAEPTTVSNTPLAATVPVTPPPPIVTNGLVLHLDAGDTASYPGTGTTWFDLSGNGRNGTLVNGVGYNSANGGSLVFDGVNDSIDILNSNSLKSEYFTFDIWFKLNTLPVGGTPLFTSHYQHYGTVSGLTVFAYQGQYWFQTRFNNSCCQDLLFGTASTNTWVNFAGTWNGSIKIAYLNGVQAGTQSISGTHSQLNNFSIGNNADEIARGNYSSAANGYIPVVKYYNRALTASEIQQNFNVTKGRFGL